ncbi:unnamed protein product [Rhizoctonia solani]|uniref:Uncharacterized protein n=1 Tax=Rhizoctonia solani TaxID=456999 RepID=A0A8H2W7E7_9AGAM|nr:unnamed protein product [Rhizoctonia solani]
MYKQRSRFRRSTTPEISSAGSILDDLTGSQDNVDNEPDHRDSGPLDSALTGSPIGIDLNDPFDNAIGWLNPDAKIYSALNLEGELDLLAHSDEKPHGVKVGTFGYVSSSSAHSPFELLSETEVGGAVFLTPQELTNDQTGENFDSGTSFSNHSMAMLIARTAPLGLGLLPNLDLTSGGSVNTSEAGRSVTPGFMHVLIKAGTPSTNPDPGSSLCATFYTYSASNHTNDDSPMFLEKCDNSFIPGEPNNTAGSTATQLWQYDPKTRELKPVLQGDHGTSAPSSAPKPNSSISLVGVEASSGNVIHRSSGSSSLAEGTRTASIQPSATARKMESDASYSTIQTHSSQGAAPSQRRVRRGKSDRMEGNEPMPLAYKAVVIVDPYTLVFVPRGATESEVTSPDTPV